jgi:DNA-binding NarL/FixJ family response regulator
VKRTKKRAAPRKGGNIDWVKKRPMPVVNILIADRDKATRAAATRVINSLRGMRIVGEAKSGLEAVSAVGAALVSVLRRKSARTRVILLVGRAPEAKILEALSHGAVGCVNKKDLSRFLPEALVAVSSGEAWMSRRLIPKIMDRLAAFTARAEGQ